MRDYLVYLAGPMTGISYEESTDWREYVASKMPSNILTLSPLRGKQYLSKESEIKDSHPEFALGCQKGITARDRFDVMRCDIILVNLIDAKKVSIGSVMEIAWADAYRKPIVLTMDADNIHSHAIIREVSGFIVPSLDEATTIIKSVLLANFQTIA